jgi:hypothetical protein
MTEAAAGAGQQPSGEAPAQTTQTATPPAAAAATAAPAAAAAAGQPAGQTPKPEEFAVSLPPGVNVDPKVLDRFKAKWLGAPPEKRAQATVDFYVELQNEAIKTNEDSVKAYHKANLEKLKADPEFGGQNFDANMEIARKPLVKFGDPELVKEMVEAGLMNHPRFAKFLHKIGQGMKEDNTPSPKPQVEADASENARLRVRYPSMFKDKATG